jgi:hypothetical protein
MSGLFLLLFAADLMEGTHDASFQERPETVDCLCVHDAINILAARVDYFVVK